MEKQEYTTEQFIKEYTEIHGDKGYDFAKTEYVDAKTKITITCPIHGDFHKIKGNHFISKGCTKCVQEEQGRRNTQKA